MKIETLAVHAGYKPDPVTKAVVPPIYQTVAYAFDSAQHGADLFDLKVAGNIYTRIMNPTQSVLEERVAALEGGLAALAVASGQSAITYAIQTIAEAGDNIVSSSALYGGTYNLFAHTFPQFGITTRFGDYRDPSSFAALIDDKTKAIFVESLGNPQGNITDIAAMAAIAHAHGIPLIVDNTVPSPYLCRPSEHGADIVVQSLTKYLGGHGNSLGGAIIDSGKFPWAEHKARFKRLNEPDVSYHGVVYTEALGAAAYIGRARVVPLRNTGAAISPFNSFLILQGIETLALRMDRICDNALAVAQRLDAARAALVEVIDFVAGNTKASPNAVFSGSVPYLMLAGNVMAGWQMGRSLLVAQKALAEGKDAAFMQAKVVTARFYADHILTKAQGLRDSIVEGADSVTALALEAF